MPLTAVIFSIGRPASDAANRGREISSIPRPLVAIWLGLNAITINGKQRAAVILANQHPIFGHRRRGQRGGSECGGEGQYTHREGLAAGFVSAKVQTNAIRHSLFSLRRFSH